MQLSTCTPLRTTCGHRRRRPTTERDVPCEFHRAPPSPGSRSSCLSPSRVVLRPSWACPSIDHVTPEETSGSGQTGGVRATRSSPQPSPSTSTHLRACRRWRLQSGYCAPQREQQRDRVRHRRRWRFVRARALETGCSPWGPQTWCPRLRRRLVYWVNGQRCPNPRGVPWRERTPASAPTRVAALSPG